MKKERIVLIISLVIMSLSSIVSAMAVSSYLYNSNEVSYNNNASGITSTNVQGAIDELYGHVTDYTSMDTRVSALEGNFADKFKNNSTSYFEGGSNEWLRMGIDNSIVGNRGIRIYGANNKIRTQFYHDGGSNVTELNSYDSSGASGQGELKIVGKPININATSGGTGDINLNGNVKVNGTEMKPKWVKLGGACSLSTSSFTNYTMSSIAPYFFIRINTSYSANGLPDYGGVTISVEELRRAVSEPIYIYTMHDVAYEFAIKYIDDTTITVKQTSGTSATTRCISIHGVL